MSADTVVLTVRLPKDIYDILRQAAYDQHTSMNALIVEAIRTQQET
jgi:predicted HicB family RNase H-like nuclease